MRRRKSTDCLSSKPLGSCKEGKSIAPRGVPLDAEELRILLKKRAVEESKGKSVPESLRRRFQHAVANLIVEMTKSFLALFQTKK